MQYIFYDFGRRYNGDWDIINSNFRFNHNWIAGELDPAFDILNILADLNYLQRKCVNKKVFQYSIFEEKNKCQVYRFIFYEGFVVYAIGSVPGDIEKK
jgi:hypothetical protein